MALPIGYHYRNLWVRKTTTVLTLLVLSAVVGVLTWMLGFAGALSASMSMASDDHKIIVIRRGSTAESNSAMPIDEYNQLAQVANLEVSSKSGEPLISPEIMIQVSLPRVRDGGLTRANVAVRGVTEKAFEVHRNVKPLGATFSTGSPEVIVGLAAAKQFGGLKIGDSIRLGFAGDRDYKIVGFFSADSGPMESEIWGYLPALMNAYGRNLYSSASLRLRSDVDPKLATDQIAGPPIEMDGKTETEYWEAQSKNIRIYLYICYALVGVMCLAAVVSIANTMYATVAGRTREIAMLRTIGYSGGSILGGFVLEAVMLSIVGGAFGCLACFGWLQLVGNTKDMFGANTFTTLAFEISLTPKIVLLAMVAVTVVGALGALLPAMRAARVQVVSALREP